MLQLSTPLRDKQQNAHARLSSNQDSQFNDLVNYIEQMLKFSNSELETPLAFFAIVCEREKSLIC